MKIIVETADKKKIVYQNVTDAYLVVRQAGSFKGLKGDIITGIETKSWSWGSNIRELTKEIRQSLFELQSFLGTQLKERK